MSKPSVVVIDYNGGNLASAAQALTYAAEQAGIDAQVTIANTPHALREADRIVLPGQGAFADCAKGLADVPSLKETLTELIQGGTPFLGICVGMQLLAEQGFEHGATKGLGWIKGNITPLKAIGLRIPQMGWNELHIQQQHPLIANLPQGAHGYFVHSYGLSDYDEADIVATTDYGGPVPAIVARHNYAGTQFHVEKSQNVGLHILKNFLTWQPSAHKSTTSLSATGKI